MKDAPQNKKGWLKLFKEWLESEVEGSESIVDENWNVEVNKKEGYLVTTSYLSPMHVGIFIQEEEDSLFANMVVKTGMNTAARPSEKRLEIYRKLLLLNDKSQLVKYALSGIDEEVTIRTDMDLNYIDKSEFSDALMQTLGAGSTLASMFDFEKEYNNAWVMNMIAILASDMKEGKITVEKIDEKLKNNLGFDEEAIEEVMAVMERVMEGVESLAKSKNKSKDDDRMFG